jgi:hypothetical protein
MLRLGLSEEDQLTLLPGKATGIPSSFQFHPFWFLDWKEEARVQKQAAGKVFERTTEVGRRFYMDFGFMRASTLYYSRPKKANDRVISSWDGYLTCWSWMRHPGSYGYSSQNQRNHRSILWILS